jgi:hypothetical protein
VGLHTRRLGGESFGLAAPYGLDGLLRFADEVAEGIHYLRELIKAEGHWISERLEGPLSK